MYSIMIPHKAWAAGDTLTALVKFSPLLQYPISDACIDGLRKDAQRCPLCPEPGGPHYFTHCVCCSDVASQRPVRLHVVTTSNYDCAADWRGAAAPTESASGNANMLGTAGGGSRSTTKPGICRPSSPVWNSHTRPQRRYLGESLECPARSHYVGGLANHPLKCLAPICRPRTRICQTFTMVACGPRYCRVHLLRIKERACVSSTGRTR